MIICSRCGIEKEPSTRNKSICVECDKANNSMISYERTHHNWIEQAQEQGINLWERQPEETQWEFTIWCRYRDSYPGKKPVYSDVAKELGVSLESIKKAASRWSFQTRMQAWIEECDRTTLVQRRSEILDMNKDHINMAAKLRETLKNSIDMLTPSELKPSDIVSLAKLATDLERTARIDVIAQEEAISNAISPDKHSLVDKEANDAAQEDLSEVLSILLKAGALGDASKIGIRQTTEVIVDKE